MTAFFSTRIRTVWIFTKGMVHAMPPDTALSRTGASSEDIERPARFFAKMFARMSSIGRNAMSTIWTGHRTFSRPITAFSARKAMQALPIILLGLCTRQGKDMPGKDVPDTADTADTADRAGEGGRQ